MDLQLSGKTALVTGSTLGIGFAAAARLAAEGARVVINGRTPARVSEALERLKSHSPRADIRGIAADLGTRAGCDALVSQLPEVDILINNVGIFEPVPFEEITDDQWLRFFDVNVMSGVRLSRAYLPAMKRKNWGRILFISSESGLQIPAEMIHYGMTKTAQLAIARGLAESCAGTGITVNSILPGPTASEGVATFVADLAKQSGQSAAEFEKEFFQSARGTSLIKRFLTPDEIASMIAFIASPLASGTTGASIRVEGGIVKSIA
jgi:NAD(P)-dependent dehydrogenase (short-subunit alcohol dehydrogenase family)